MKVRVTRSNLYRDGRRCSVGETFDIEGDTIPTVYLGKVEPVEQGQMEVATPDAKVNETGNDTSAEADEQRKEWLLDQIEELTGKRPGANSKLETLEAKYEDAKLAEE